MSGQCQPSAVVGVRPRARAFTIGLVFAVVASFFAPASTFAALNWTLRHPMPTGSYLGASAVAAGQFYVIGGQPPSGFATTAVFAYDPVADAWTSLAAAPSSRSAAAAVEVGGKIYVVGGWLNSDSNSPTGALEIYDVGANAWSVGPAAPISRGNISVAAIGDKIYVTGGRGPCCFQYDQLDIYDTTLGTWSTGAPLPVKVEGAASAAVNGKFYVIGGGTAIAGPAFSITAGVQIYDPATNSWTTGEPMPTARGGAAAGVLDGLIHVVSGSSATSRVDTHEVYDPSTNSWSTAEPIPVARTAAAGGSIGSTLYVVGGHDGTSVSDLLHAFSEPPRAPTVVTNTNDSGEGSLRAAIENANANAGPDVISFAIPTTDPGFTGTTHPDFTAQWYSIRPTSPLPSLTDGETTIDGSSQTRLGDTNPYGPEIEVNGALAGPANGLLADSSGNVIHSLVVNGFASSGPGTGLGIQLRNADNVVTGSYLGVNPTGTAAVPNGETGVSVGHDAVGNRIGGPTAPDRNLISGNGSYGVILLNDAADTVVEGNYIGTNASGTGAIANGSGDVSHGGMHVQGNDNVIRGNVVSGNDGHGIGLFMPASRNVVLGNRVGTNAAGDAAIPNTRDGIAAGGPGNTIGGGSPSDRNVISGNGELGVTVFQGSGNVIEGNYIGTDLNGMAAVANGRGGVSVHSASDTAIRDNVISGNTGDGVTIHFEGATGNVVAGNYIGTNADGTEALPNTQFDGGGGGSGVVVRSSRNTIGGPALDDRNVISGNAQAGIALGNPTEFGGAADVRGNAIEGNYIGTNASGTAAIGNGTTGVFVFGPENLIADNVVSGNGRNGIAIADDGNGNVVHHNYVGTNAEGDAAVPNGDTGISVHHASATAIERNVVSGNMATGIHVFGANATTIEANLIGTDASGEAPLGNRANGIELLGAADTQVDRNVISANGDITLGQSRGAFLIRNSAGTTIQGNLIGTDGTGIHGLGNAVDGLRLELATTDTLIGGTQSGDQNVISGNGRGGIVLVGFESDKPAGTRILGNFIGTDASGATPIANEIGMVLGGSGTVVKANVVSGNVSAGIWVGTEAGALVQGNLIGTDAAGTADVGNGLVGILLTEVTADTMIESNTVAFNGGAGVIALDATVRNRISANAIFGNKTGDGGVVCRVRCGSGITLAPGAGLGIDLDGDGVTANDAGDSDTGPNELQNYPVLVVARLTPLGLRVNGHIDTPNAGTVTIELFANRLPAPGGDPSGHGEGAEFLGTVTPEAGGAFTVLLPPVPDGTLITATATDAAGNTSEFALNVAADGPSP